MSYGPDFAAQFARAASFVDRILKGARPAGLPRQLIALALFCLVALPASAQRDTQQLTDFRNESEAFNRQDPFANAFRAGHYSGYIAGVLDTLQGRSVCFKECICEIDKIVGQYLADHPKSLERPAIEWLVPLLQSRYPCK